MSDARPGPTPEQRLGHLLRGVLDEHRVQSRADVAHVGDRVVRLESQVGHILDVVTALGRAVEAVLREQQALTQLLRRDVLGELSELAHGDDVRREVDRVMGEVRALDARVGAMADDVRLVRVLRDGLSALADGVDGVRQLAAKAATSQQMSDVTRELGGVLAEIEAARSQVLRVEATPSPTPADVVQVGGTVSDLGRRIEHLTDVIEERLVTAPPPAAEPAAVDQLTERLRQVSASARQLGNSVLDEFRNRRSSGKS